MVFNVKAFAQILAKYFSTRIWLFFGADVGRPSILSKQLLKKLGVQQDNVLILDYAELARDPSILVQELYTINPFIVGKRAIIIDKTSDILDKELEKIFKQYQAISIKTSSQDQNSDRHPYLVLLGGEMKKNSRTRAFFECNSTSNIAINCYKESHQTLINEVKDFLLANKVSFLPHIPQMIVNSSSDDSMSLHKELEKISLFLGITKDKRAVQYELTEEDVLNLNNREDIQLSSLVEDICGNESASIMSKIGKSQVKPIPLLRAVQWYSFQALAVKNMIRGKNKSFDKAVDELRLPFFQERREKLQKSLKNKLSEWIIQAIKIENTLYWLPSAVHGVYVEYVVVISSLFKSVINNKRVN